jgi:hypothetical protein
MDGVHKTNDAGGMKELVEKRVVWGGFCVYDNLAGNEKWYASSERAPDTADDYRVCLEDARAGVTAAIEKMKRFTVWRLKQ